MPYFHGFYGVFYFDGKRFPRRSAEIAGLPQARRQGADHTPLRRLRTLIINTSHVNGLAAPALDADIGDFVAVALYRELRLTVLLFKKCLAFPGASHRAEILGLAGLRYDGDSEFPFLRGRG
jgi:hypothetical protein